ncbi:MAG: electron transport complex protein RnfA [Gammaproteobacteria bacterium]
MIAEIEQSAGIVFLSTVLANNLVLESQLALCPLFAASRRIDVATGMATVSIVVMVVMSLISFAIHQYVLKPYELTYLSLIINVLMLVVLMQAIQSLVENKYPGMNKKYGVFLPLLLFNCSVLAVILLTLKSADSIGMAFIFSLGCSVGFGLVLIMFAGLRERIEQIETEQTFPEAFKGAPIILITLGIFSMAFYGF